LLLYFVGVCLSLNDAKAAPWERVFAMNKAITDGVLLMPPAFGNGLGVWSSGDGTARSDTYANAANVAFVPADQDSSGCLEIQKTTTTTRLRYMGGTPLLPGCYLRVSARIKRSAAVYQMSVSQRTQIKRGAAL
tara:strand:+ start:726 stop:1127 length:402 start_codon:yes stop_codon:yes gene_type:complete